MTFRLARIREQLQSTPMAEPVAEELAVALIQDTLRLAGRAPIRDALWDAWRKKAKKGALWHEQVSMLGWFLIVSDALREDSIAGWRTGKTEAEPALERLWEAIAPLTGEMMRSNAFRQEEFLRRWAEALGAPIDGETPKASAEALGQLDYRVVLQEYARAEAAREKEEAARAEALRKAEEERREAEARAWRE